MLKVIYIFTKRSDDQIRIATMSNPIGATQESLGKLYADAFTKKGPKDVLVNATSVVIQDQYLRKEDEGGIYCIKILAINGVDISIKDTNNREYFLIKIGVAKNYEDRYKGHGFTSEAVFEINGDHLMENWLLRRIPGSVRDAFVGKGAKVGAVRKKLGFHYTDKGGPSPGPTEWRIVTSKFFEKLESMNQGNAWLKKMNNINYRSEFRELASGVAGSGDVDFPSYSLLFPAQTLKIIRHVPGKPGKPGKPDKPGKDVAVENALPLRVMCLRNEGGGGGILVGTGAAAVRVKREKKADGKYFESITRTQAEWESAWAAGETEFDDLREIDFHHVDSDDEGIDEEDCDEENADSAEESSNDSEDDAEPEERSNMLEKINKHKAKLAVKHEAPPAPVAHR